MAKKLKPRWSTQRIHDSPWTLLCQLLKVSFKDETGKGDQALRKSMTSWAVTLRLSVPLSRKAPGVPVAAPPSAPAESLHTSLSGGRTCLQASFIMGVFFASTGALGYLFNWNWNKRLCSCRRNSSVRDRRRRQLFHMVGSAAVAEPPGQVWKEIHGPRSALLPAALPHPCAPQTECQLQGTWYFQRTESYKWNIQ